MISFARFCQDDVSVNSDSDGIIANYYRTLPVWADEEQYTIIAKEGERARQAAQHAAHFWDEAHISAQLCYLALCMQQFEKARCYVSRCRNWSQSLKDYRLVARIYCLSAAVFSGLAAQKRGEEQARYYQYSLHAAVLAQKCYGLHQVHDLLLKGMIYFYLAEASARTSSPPAHPFGDTTQPNAYQHYQVAWESFDAAEVPEASFAALIQYAELAFRQKHWPRCAEAIHLAKTKADDDEQRFRVKDLKLRYRIAQPRDVPVIKRPQVAAAGPDNPQGSAVKRARTQNALEEGDGTHHKILKLLDDIIDNSVEGVEAFLKSV